MRKLFVLLATIGLLASACGEDDMIPSPPDGDDGVVIDIGGENIRLTSALSGFDSCDTLLDHLRTEGAERVGPYGFNDGWYGGWWPGGRFLEDDVDMAEGGDDAGDGAAAFDAPTSSGASNEATADLVEGVDFSGTNIQESGVDEADIVKTDGERVFIVASGELVVIDVATRTVTGTVTVPRGDRNEMFVSGDDILLISQGWFEDELHLAEDIGIAVDEPAADIAIEPGPGYGWNSSTTTITRITVDGGSPRIVETLVAEGDYVTARSVDGTARIIVRSNPQYNFPFVYPQSEAGEERAEASNREALLDTQLSDWLPGYAIVDANGATTDEGLLVPCNQVHAPTEFAGFGVLSVLTVDVDGDLTANNTSAVLAPGEIVYASTDSVYVATTTWFDQAALDIAFEQIQENITTSIHRFDITSDRSAAYTASGSVDGLVRDSFSFSEYDGHLRVVTTTGNQWDETSESWLRVLEEQGDRLVEVGQVGDMGNGEAVQSVRFHGDVGYVVTFRQVDPFYTVDLRDPTDPVVRGELKIPGFSSYLHPIGDGLVLGVGSDADETGRVTGSKVSLFDVTDLDNPLEVDVWAAPDSWNNVGWDTHAFLWWAPENLAAVPVQTWENGQNWAGIVLLRVENGAITEVGRIDHDDPTSGVGETECTQITEDDLPTQSDADIEFESEFGYMLSEGYGMIIDCAPGESRSVTGFSCYDEPWMAEEAERAGVPIEGTLIACWPDSDGMPQISRSIVLPGDELWTVSSPWGWLGGSNPARLQVNDLTTFDRLDAIDL
ncbi:MAG: beta-propeller domain-containing protein [Acidimicrobiales bacterium]|nr:beta-propeller domain-containing protein [Acidimicrobiales bacterium]